MPSRRHAAWSAAILLGLATACGPSGGAAFKDLPPEKSFDCAASIFAVHNLMEIKPGNPDADAVKSNGLGAITHYGTIYAEAEGLGSQEVLALIKLKAYRMTGRLPGAARVSRSAIIGRAKACITPDVA